MRTRKVTPVTWRRALLGAGALSTSLAGPAVMAAEGGAIEEVVVTAQRTSESIQDVPIAVTALSGKMMEDKQVLTASDLQLNAPNVSFSATNFGGSNFSIRGIGRLVIATTGEAGVSTHINEIPIASNLNAVEFFDVQRVEVLRGPQGTLFGRNATGGAVNMVTNMPEFDNFSGMVDAEYGNYSNVRFKAAVNIPLADNFAMRVAGLSLKRDGFTKNLAFGQVGQVIDPLTGVTSLETLPNIDRDVDGRDLWAGRVTFKWDITERASAWFQFNRFSEDDDRARITNQVCVRNDLPTTGCDPNAFGFEQPHLGSTTGGIFGGQIGALPLGANGTESFIHYDYPAPAGVGFRAMHTDFEPVFQNDEDNFLFGIDYEFDKFTVGLLAAYQKTKYLSQQDYQMNVGPTLNPTAANPTGYWPTSRPAGGAGDDWRPGPCNLYDGTTGVEGGCIYPADTNRIFAYDQSDAESDYWTMEVKLSSTFDGMFNFTVGVNGYSGETYGDYYVLANTLDMVTDYGVPGLGFPPLYPGYFNNTSAPSGGAKQEGYAAFGEMYFDLTDTIKLTAGLRYNKDEKSVKDTSVLFNAVDLNAVLGNPDPNNQFFTRVTGFLLGVDSDVALGNLYAPALVQAALGTAPLSPERLAVHNAVPLVPDFGETRLLTGSPSKESWEEFSGRIGVDWQINDNSMAYFFYSRGYKPGGFNPAIPVAFQSTSSFTFDSEQIDAFEIGTKNTFMDGSLVVNGSLFWYDYGGLQVTRIANNSSLNDNIDAKIWGLELETYWKPEFAPGLSVDFAYSYLSAEVDGSDSVDPVNRTAGSNEWVLLENTDPGSLTGVNYIARKDQITQAVVTTGLNGTPPGFQGLENGQTISNVTYPANEFGVAIPAYASRTFLQSQGVTTSDGLPTNLDGNELPNSPNHTIHLGLAYTWALDRFGGDLTLRWDYYWQSKMYGREFNTKGDKIDAWDQHNASLIYESTDGRWEGKFFIRNIENEDNVTGKYLTSDTSGFFRNYFLTEPRIYGASVRYNFGAQ
ncbi:MAG: TonB-dependent receptor [Pseudomonadales bacterium]